MANDETNELTPIAPTRAERRQLEEVSLTERMKAAIGGVAKDTAAGRAIETLANALADAQSELATINRQLMAYNQQMMVLMTQQMSRAAASADEAGTSDKPADKTATKPADKPTAKPSGKGDTTIADVIDGIADTAEAAAVRAGKPKGRVWF